MSQDDRRVEEPGNGEANLVEALAHSRADLVERPTAQERAALEDDIASARHASQALSVALRRAVPLEDVDDLVQSALRHADISRPSRRSLRVGAVLGTLALAVSASVSIALGGAESLDELGRFVRTSLTLGGALGRGIAALPGGDNSLSIVLSLALVVVWAGLRIVDRGRVARTGALLLPVVLGGALYTTPAHAYELEGHCGATPVRVSVDRAPRSVALRQALASGGLGLAYSLPDDPIVSLHVGRAPLTQVLDALLGHSAVRVRCAGGIVALEPTTAMSAPYVPIGVMRGAPLTTASIADMMTFGGDAFIARLDEVRDVVTMGGDARIDGRAYGDVITMGGDAEISGLVVGDVFTMGGDIRVAPEGAVHGHMSAMGGEVRDARVRLPVAVPPPNAPYAPPFAALAMPACDPDAWGVVDFLGSAARHALVFLFGLVFLALAPGRLRTITHALVDRPGRSTVAGVLTMLGLPLLILALAITLIGIPVAAVVALGGVLALGTGLVSSAMVIGAAIPSRRLSGRPVAQLAAGTAALFLVSRLPWVGGLAWVLALVAGLGAIALTRAGSRPSAG